MIAEKPPTQAEQVLHELRLHPDGVCILDVPVALGYTLRNRISELRDHGFPIVARPCRFHQHRGTVVRYSLTGSPLENLELPL